MKIGLMVPPDGFLVKHSRILLLVFFAYYITCNLSLYAQENEKSITNQSLLIDALREEQINNHDKALEILEQLKYEQEFKDVCYYLIAKIYISQQKFEQALNAIDQSLSIDSKNKWYLVLKANITEQLGEYKITAETYLDLVSVEPNNYTFYDNTAYFYLKARMTAEALNMITKAESNFGLNPQIALKKSHILKAENQWLNAVDVLVSCLKIYPSHSELKEEIIKLHQEIPDETIQKLLQEKYPEIFPAPENSQINSINELIELVSSSTTDLDTKIKKFVQVLSKEENQEHYSSLIPVAENLLNQYPKDPKTSCLLADIYFLKDQYAEAVRYYKAAQNLGPVPFSIWSNLLYCLIELNRWQELLSSAELCLDYYPNQSIVYLSLAKAHLEMGHFDLALRELDRLEPMTKYNKQKSLEYLRMKLLVLESNRKDATAVMQEADQLQSSNCLSLESLRIRCQNGIKPSADVLQSAKELCPDQDKSKAFILSQVYWCTGNKDQAKYYIKMALDICNYQNPSVLKLGISIFTGLGDESTVSQLSLKLQQIENPLH